MKSLDLRLNEAVTKLSPVFALFTIVADVVGRRPRLWTNTLLHTLRGTAAGPSA